MKGFLDDDFLLENKTAQVLYHEYAKGQPIIDYHNHLAPSDIAQNRLFENMTKVWLDGDHYKWRAMRTLGISEHYITGQATDEQKFLKWAEAVPQTVRNPLFHWTHLELRRYFGIEDILSPQSASHIYSQCNDLLTTPSFTPRALLSKMNVELICTTDDPTNDLRHHIDMADADSEVTMLMTFRPDKAIIIGNEGYLDYLTLLGEVADVEIKDYETLLEALQTRMQFFHDKGCRLSDHGLSQISATTYTQTEVDSILKKRLKGERLGPEEIDKFQSAILYDLCRAYAQKGWVQQFHLGALRNTNDRLHQSLGPDTGFDSIGDFNQAQPLSSLLNRLDSTNDLAQTVIYNLNPRDNEVMAAMIGNYNDGTIRGKMQYGSAWWFLDQKDGIEKQINALSNVGMLSCFIGMLTDSRSILSFPRHEYFRRILCNLIGRDVHNGELPNDTKWLGEIVADICYRNAKSYFNF